MTDWNSELYLRYERERTQPSLDLASRIPLEEPKEVIDLGCGPGNSTRVLRQRWPNCSYCRTGLLAGDDRTGLSKFNRRGVARRRPSTWSETGRFDVIFANASLHWIEGHEVLVPRLVEAPKPEGALAFQMPALYNQPASQAANELAKSPSWQPYRLRERSTLSSISPARTMNGYLRDRDLCRSGKQFIFMNWRITAKLLNFTPAPG